MAFTTFSSTSANPTDLNNNFYHVGQGDRFPLGGAALDSTNGAFDIGNSTYPWRNIYCAEIDCPGGVPISTLRQDGVKIIGWMYTGTAIKRTTVTFENVPFSAVTVSALHVITNARTNNRVVKATVRQMLASCTSFIFSNSGVATSTIFSTTPALFLAHVNDTHVVLEKAAGPDGYTSSSKIIVEVDYV